MSYSDLILSLDEDVMLSLDQIIEELEVGSDARKSIVSWRWIIAREIESSLEGKTLIAFQEANKSHYDKLSPHTNLQLDRHLSNDAKYHESLPRDIIVTIQGIKALTSLVISPETKKVLTNHYTQ